MSKIEGIEWNREEIDQIMEKEISAIVRIEWECGKSNKLRSKNWKCEKIDQTMEKEEWVRNCKNWMKMWGKCSNYEKEHEKNCRKWERMWGNRSN